MAKSKKPAKPSKSAPATVLEKAVDATADTDSGGDDLEQLSVAELAAQLRSAREENAQLNDALLRAQAEAENIQRRAQNEIATGRKFALEGFARELLEVKDNLERAAEVQLDATESAAVRNMNEGLALTLKQLDAVLTRFSVLEVEAAPGIRLDPEVHQAISVAASAEIQAGHIVSVVQKGFTLNARLLRPAMVVVAQ